MKQVSGSLLKVVKHAMILYQVALLVTKQLAIRLYLCIKTHKSVDRTLGSITWTVRIASTTTIESEAIGICKRSLVVQLVIANGKDVGIVEVMDILVVNVCLVMCIRIRIE